MSALAGFMLYSGKKAGGYDARQSVYTDNLLKFGAEISFSDDPTDVDGCDVLVYTDAFHTDDARIVRARKLKKTVLSRGEFLGEVCGLFKRVTAVAGCHGKTTCTAMLAHVYAAAGKKFAMHAGGRDSYFGNFFISGNDRFITEACEYKKNFLFLKPDIAVILNVEPDHLECYGSEENLREAYKSFSSAAGKTVVKYGCGLDGITFGYEENADYRACRVKCEKGIYTFTACCRSEELGQITVGVYGAHNVLNALAVTAAAHTDGIAFEAIKAGVESFCGVERRMEGIGSVNGAKWIADYAHHPTEIKAALNAFESVGADDLFVVFQPHTYSRTKNLFNDFISVLSSVKNLMIYRTFAAREYFDDEGSALTLAQNLKNSTYGDDPRDITDFLSQAGKNSVVLFLGAGDIYEIAKRITAKINE